MDSEFRKLDGSWGIVTQTQMTPDTLEVPLVACGGKPDKHRGVFKGRVLSGVTRNPLADVTISYAHSQGRCETSTDRYGEYAITVEAWAGVGSTRRKISYSKEGFEAVDAFYQVALGQSTWVEPLALVPEYSRGMRLGAIVGVMRSSSTGKRILQVCSCTVCQSPSVHLRRGAHSQDTRVMARSKIKHGKFAFRRLMPGVYTVEMKAECYIPRLATLVVLSGRLAVLSQNVFMVPQFVMLNKPRLRFVLTWAKLPLDLDLHLLVPQEQAGIKGLWAEVAASQSVGHKGSYNHRMYNSKHLKIYFNGKGSQERAPFSELVVNSTHGFGPEELIVHKPFYGRYMLYVRKKGQDVPLEQSNAKVEIFKDNDLIETVHIEAHGSSLTKRIWNVIALMGKV